MKATATKPPKKLAFQRIKMEFEKANFQSKVSANKSVSKTDKIEAIRAKETNNKPNRKTE
ncbi:hypothetical protein ND926_14300 [Vibrio diabolicus]|uniref:hypothetical protein n=1 Tax=Vibrio diabolicus TaxID=50719 RepID=UPI00215E09A7|nr:hypothetical protein [Vibrio diabolicus]MCR9566075.1 hypothetical protein [Vibrio alginolyticus]MCS0338628.1 hypothetical protein [Vibrio diabolicus]